MLIVQPAMSYTHMLCEEGPNGRMECIEVENEDKCGVNVGDVRKACMAHWIHCPNCPIRPFEACWRWVGEDDVEFVDGGEETMTGWEMWAELVMRSETTKVDQA